MLRFANLVLSNPAKPELKIMEVKAIITEGDFGLAVGAHIVDKLGLKQIDLRSVTEAGKKGECLVPYVGPVRVNCGGKDVFTGAMNCINGVAIGSHIVKELHLDVEVQNGSGFRQGLLPFTGMPISDRAHLAKYIMIKENAIDEATCKIICNHVRQNKQKHVGVEVVENSVMPGVEAYKHSKEHARDAFTIDTDGINTMLGGMFYTLFTKHISTFFGVEIESWERPQLLSYERGGRYDSHADGETTVRKPAGNKIWRKYLNRDISIILYLNDEFTGGDLVFPAHAVRIRPRPGLLVAFPSTADYMHGAEPTESGDRIVLVTWAAIQGSARMIGESKNHVYMKNFEKHDQ